MSERHTEKPSGAVRSTLEKKVACSLRVCLSIGMMDNQTPVAAPVNWEAVRALAMVVGVREAARRMGLKESAAQQRSAREGWLASAEAKQVNRMAVAQRSGITSAACNQLSPAALIQGEIAALGSKTRLSLARAVGKAGEHAETLTGAQVLEASSDIKNLTQTADVLHGWKDTAPSVKIRLDVLGAAQEQPLIDVSADVTPCDAWDYEDELDSY